jgi:alkylhydroperoxidase/carboxymuconolactone decarboxylase family protein YurZ
MLEEKVIASWVYKKGVLEPKTASLCYLAANLAVGNTHCAKRDLAGARAAGATEDELREAISFAIRANAARAHADILTVYGPPR